MPVNLPIAGWYPDPENPGQDRWWGGSSWTDHRRPHESAAAPAAPTAASGAVEYAYGPAAPTPSAYAPGYGTPAYYQPAPTNTLALVGMILAIAGVIFGLAAPAGGILGIVGLKRSRELAEQGYANTGRGMAITAIAVGFGLTALGIIFFVLYFAFIAWAIGQSSTGGGYYDYSSFLSALGR